MGDAKNPVPFNRWNRILLLRCGRRARCGALSIIAGVAPGGVAARRSLELISSVVPGGGINYIPNTL